MGVGKSKKDPLRPRRLGHLPRKPGGGGWLVFGVFVAISLCYAIFGGAFDGVDYALEVGEDIAGVDAEDVEALGLHPLVAVLVVFELVALVLVAVDFDDEAWGVAVEVGDVWA